MLVCVGVCWCGSERECRQRYERKIENRQNTLCKGARELLHCSTVLFTLPLRYFGVIFSLPRLVHSSLRRSADQSQHQNRA